MHCHKIFCLFFSSVLSVEINKVSIPSAVEADSDQVLLDCNFSYNETEASQLEVKWYFNQDPVPFCQWIAGRPGSEPQVIGRCLMEESL